MLRSLAIANYRSIRDLVLPLGAAWNRLCGAGPEFITSNLATFDSLFTRIADPAHWPSRQLALEPNPM